MSMWGPRLKYFELAFVQTVRNAKDGQRSLVGNEVLVQTAAQWLGRSH